MLNQYRESADYPLENEVIVAAKADNKLVDLGWRLDNDRQVEFVPLSTRAGTTIYRRTLTFLLIRAARELYPEVVLKLEHSISKGLYCTLDLGRELTQEDVDALRDRMKLLIEQDDPFVREEVSQEQAVDIFRAQNQEEKVRLFKHLYTPKVTTYVFGPLRDYFDGPLLPSAGYLKKFDLRFYAPGFILRFPRYFDPSRLPRFTEQRKMFEIFQEHTEWARILQVEYVGHLNELIAEGRITEFVQIAEALHSRKVARIADEIVQRAPIPRVILISGPSASGKTTFAKRLSTELRVLGLRPMTLSLDDYFVERGLTPRSSDGDYDFEHLEALDLPFFNQQLTALLEGKEVHLPRFDFREGTRRMEPDRTCQLESDQCILVEGIHGLNPRLTSKVAQDQKFLIYVSALTQLNVDNHYRIRTTDTRVVRRLVRDAQFRSYSAMDTLRRWPSVRKGEERWVFPFQERADMMFNSVLLYEHAVLKRSAEPLLHRIPRSEPEYSEARRLLKFLGFFLGVDHAEVPGNSIIQEFLGQSTFRY